MLIQLESLREPARQGGHHNPLAQQPDHKHPLARSATARKWWSSTLHEMPKRTTADVHITRTEMTLFVTGSSTDVAFIWGSGARRVSPAPRLPASSTKRGPKKGRTSKVAGFRRRGANRLKITINHVIRLFLGHGHYLSASSPLLRVLAHLGSDSGAP